MRVVKKTLKGDLMGKTGFKKVAATRTRPAEGNGRGPDTLDTDHSLAASEAEADLAATSLGVTPSMGGRRGVVAHLKDGAAVPTFAASTGPGRWEGESAPLASGSSATLPATPASALPSTPSAHPSTLTPTRTTTRTPTPPSTRSAPLGTRLEGGVVDTARNVVAESLFRDLGATGTKMQHPRGGSFQVQARFGEGIVRSQHDLLLPLPAGHVTSHTADLVIELEPVGLLVLDIVPSHVTVQELKARAFDTLQMRRIDRCFSVLVFIRCPGSGMSQGQAEAIGHGYDHTFGIDEEHILSGERFRPLRTRILSWLEAASSANVGLQAGPRA